MVYIGLFLVAQPIQDLSFDLLYVSTELSAAGTGGWAQSLATVSQQTSGARQSQAQALCI